MTDSLLGRVVLVTGAGRSIGRAVADDLAAHGAEVVGIDREFGTRASGWRSVTADVTDAATMAAVVSEALDAQGRIHGLVNNAAISDKRPFADIDEEVWRRLHEVNLRAPFAIAREVVPHMPAGGSIVNISSIRARVAFAEDAAYIAAKGGVDALTRALAVELAPRGIRVNAVAPGAIDTDMNAAALSDPETRARAIARIPLGRLGRSEDVAAAVRFLVSPSSDFITGSVLTVDGGQTALG